MSGEAKTYYEPSQGFDQGQSAGYNGETARPNYDSQAPVSEAKPPPPYPQQPADPPPPYKTFDDAFKIERPKYNDLWAGILVSFLRSLANINSC